MSDEERMKAIRNMAFIAGFLAGMVTGIIIMQMAGYEKAQAAVPVQQVEFDHSNCQYPDRWSNPENGCDNSDPAVPECIKGMATKEMEEACIADFVKQHEPVSTPTVPTMPELKQPESPACEGK